MAYNLNPNLSIPNATRIVLVDFEEIRTNKSDPDSVAELRTTLELRSGNASDRTFGRYVLLTRNSAVGPSDRLKLRPGSGPDAFVAGMALEDILQVERGVLTLASGLTTLLAAWRGGAQGGRKDATLTALATLGQIEAASLPGTVS